MASQEPTTEVDEYSYPLRPKAPTRTAGGPGLGRERRGGKGIRSGGAGLCNLIASDLPTTSLLPRQLRLELLELLLSLGRHLAPSARERAHIPLEVAHIGRRRRRLCGA